MNFFTDYFCCVKRYEGYSKVSVSFNVNVATKLSFLLVKDHIGKGFGLKKKYCDHIKLYDLPSYMRSDIKFKILEDTGASKSLKIILIIAEGFKY